MAQWLLELSGSSPENIAVGIEVTRGPVVETLLGRGFGVHSINPRQLDRFLEAMVRIKDYPGDIRQIAVIDLGHEKPTFLLTNQMEESAGALIDRYARRMIIENIIADTVDFFHMDALSAAVAMKINVDV